MQSKNRSVRSTVHCFVHIHLRNTESDNLSQIRVEFNISEVDFLHAHLSQEKLLWNKIFYRYKQVFTFLLHFVTILSITCQVSIKILRRLSDPACPHLSSGVTGLPCWSSKSCHCLFCPKCVGVSNQVENNLNSEFYCNNCQPPQHLQQKNPNISWVSMSTNKGKSLHQNHQDAFISQVSGLESWGTSGFWSGSLTNISKIVFD